MTEREIFVAAIHQPGPDERRAFLDQACGGNDGLRAQVEALLAAHDGVGSFLEEPAPQPTGAFELAADPTPVAKAEKAGGSVGPYKLLEVIGEGGMGTVWMADQVKPIRRRVAVKVVKPGMDSRQVLARFEAERQALALMDHPNIARVLDAGTTENGRPYFVMELVRGVPLTKFCDDRHMGVQDRLRIFQQVCSAVQHAHQKGVIHRDLKPSNVLVESHDGKAVPKVIDFGLAKAAGVALTDRSLFTHFGAMLGTPLYMAPEQAEFGGLDVDTRADVYALGVLLYELLTGTTPIERGRLAKAAWDEIRRVIKEEEPPSPSARLSSSEGRASVAALRQAEPGKLAAFVRSDLDWVVMKALAKERDRRYESASAFASDVERFLNHEPVAAGPPTASYKLRRFVRRNRPQVIAAGLVLAALVAGIVGTTVGLVWANAARKDAEAAKIAEGERVAEAVREKARAEKGEKLAGERLVQVEAEKKRAEEEKRVALAVQDFLQHKLLSQADPNIQAGAILRQGGQTSEVKENPTVRELLDRAAKELAPDRIEASFPKQPLVQAHILNTVGVTYHSVGEYRKAIDLLERSTAILTAHAGADHDDTLTVMNHLANAHRSVGNHRRNIELKERIRDMRLKKLGADHQATLTATNNLAHAYRQTDDVHLNSLAIKLMEQLRDTYAKRPDDANISAIVSLWNLIFWYPIGDERIARSLALMERIRDAHTAKFGPDAPATLHANYQVAWAYHNARRLPQAAELFERVLEAQGRILGVDHPETLTTGRRLVDAYLGQNPTVGQRRNYPRAAELMERIHADTLARLGPTHLLTLNSFATLALTYSRMGRHDKAIQLHEELLKRKEAQFGRQHISTLSTVCRLGMCYKDAGRQAEGLALYEEAFWNPRTGPRERLWVGDELLDARVKAGRPKEAAKLAKELVAVARRWSATDPLTFIDRLCNYSERLTSVKAFEEAEPLLQEATAISEQQPPEKQWRKYRTMSVRGACLVEQQRYVEAERLLLDAYAGLEARVDYPDQKKFLLRGADRLILLYTRWGKPAEAKKWQAERDKYPPKAVEKPVPPPAKKP